jgi:cell division protein FtsI (penicillin-binding protein 3)
MSLSGPYMKRLLIATVAGAIVWIALLLRLVQLQILDHERHAADALRQHQRRVTLAAQRGSILDRRGEALAVDVSNPSLFVDPREVKDPGATARELCRRFPGDRARIEAAVRADGGFAWVTRAFLDVTEAERAAREVRGVHVCEEQKRIYPAGAAAAHVVGFTSTDGVGLEGIEKAFDEELRGREGWTTEYLDARGRAWTPAGSAVAAPTPGRAVVLTIDRRFQEIAEDRLHKAVEETRSVGGSVVIMDPRTGEILALANEPCYAPESPGSGPKDWLRNRAVTDRFEPGSTFKIVAAGAALEKQRVRRDTIFETGGGVQKVAGVELRDASAHGTITFEEVIAYSSNIGTARAALLVGEGDFYRFARRFGFGQKTGVDLPGEVEGTLRAPGSEKWSGRSLITAAIGQEVSVTALQLATSFCVIANDGVLMRPFVTRAVLDATGRAVSTTEPERVRRVVSASTARQLREFLALGVEEGTGRKADVPWCKVGGKTGTAQKFVNGTYRSGKYVSSFCGFLPADDPEIVCLVVLDEPRGAYYGGTVAAPVFRDIVAAMAAADKGLLGRFGRKVGMLDAGERWADDNLPTADSLVASVAPAVAAVTRQPVATTRASVELKLSPPSEIQAPPTGFVVVPDVHGLAAREAYRLLCRQLLAARLVGTGRVIAQEPAAGSVVERGQVCVLTLAGERLPDVACQEREGL